MTSTWFTLLARRVGTKLASTHVAISMRVTATGMVGSLGEAGGFFHEPPHSGSWGWLKRNILPPDLFLILYRMKLDFLSFAVS